MNRSLSSPPSQIFRPNGNEYVEEDYDDPDDVDQTLTSLRCVCGKPQALLLKFMNIANFILFFFRLSPAPHRQEIMEEVTTQGETLSRLARDVQQILEKMNSLDSSSTHDVGNSGGHHGNGGGDRGSGQGTGTPKATYQPRGDHVRLVDSVHQDPATASRGDQSSSAWTSGRSLDTAPLLQSSQDQERQEENAGSVVTVAERNRRVPPRSPFASPFPLPTGVPLHSLAPRLDDGNDVTATATTRFVGGFPVHNEPLRRAQAPPQPGSAPPNNSRLVSRGALPWCFHKLGSRNR
jgi:hypothetical protein